MTSRLSNLLTLNDELSDGTLPSPDLTGRDDGRMHEMGGEGELFGRVRCGVQPVALSVRFAKCLTVTTDHLISTGLKARRTSASASILSSESWTCSAPRRVSTTTLGR